MTGYLVTRTDATGPEMYDGVFSTCVVELNEANCREVINRVARAVELAAAEEKLSSLHWRSDLAEFYAATPQCCEGDDPELEDAFANGAYLVLDAEQIKDLLASEPEEVMFPKMVVMPQSNSTIEPEVFFQANPRYASVSEESAAVPVSVFREELKRLHPWWKAAKP